MKTITIRLALFGLIGIPVLSGAGCTHVPLRRNTSRQAETLSEIYQQQVLDNLAKFVYDYNSLPHFAYANAGSTTVSDTATASGTVNWARIFFDTGDLGFTGSRNNEEAWTLTPVSDPRKLELMRCAYQRAVSSCVAQAESGGCPDCEKRFRDYYTGSPDGKIPAPGSPEDPGIVTSECLRSDCCWFHVACKGCVGKHGPCCRVGHYRGVYVVVPPGRGQAELTELTLAVLDYAVNKPAEEESVPSKEVTLYLDAEGRPTNQAGAARVIKANAMPTMSIASKSFNTSHLTKKRPLNRGRQDRFGRPN